MMVDPQINRHRPLANSRRPDADCWRKNAGSGETMTVSHQVKRHTPKVFRLPPHWARSGSSMATSATSPLYALKEAAKAATHGGPLTHEAILGVVSLILWALILIISVKYAAAYFRARQPRRRRIVRCWRCSLPECPVRNLGARNS